MKTENDSINSALQLHPKDVAMFTAGAEFALTLSDDKEKRNGVEEIVKRLERIERKDGTCYFNLEQMAVIKNELYDIKLPLNT